MKYLLFLIFISYCGSASSDTFSNKLASFKSLDSSTGKFVEKWDADYLEDPLVSKGTLNYKRPGQLSKIISDPEKIEQHIKDNKLSITHNGKTQIFQLTEQPELAISIYALQALLDGDEDRLNELFNIKYSENDAHWDLLLPPTNKQVSEQVEVILFQGSSNKILRISLQFYNGDSLVTEISHEE